MTNDVGVHQFMPHIMKYGESGALFHFGSFLANCTSFVVMRELGTDTAFSFDWNFEEAGFTRLP